MARCRCEHQLLTVRRGSESLEGRCLESTPSFSYWARAPVRAHSSPSGRTTPQGGHVSFERMATWPPIGWRRSCRWLTDGHHKGRRHTTQTT